MTRPRIIFLALLGVAVVLSAASIPCRACDRSASIAWMGTIYYAALLLLALWREPGRLVYGGIFIALGVHLLLVLRMAQTSWCVLCLLAAANALALAVVTLISDRRNWAVAGTFLPLSSLALFLLPRPAPAAIPESVVEAPQAGVRILVLERSDCPYCKELRETHLARLAAEFGRRVELRFRSADDFPGIERTPTLVLTGPQTTRVINGLPPYVTLVRAVEDCMGDRP